MSESKLTKEQAEDLAKKHLKHREKMRKAQAKRRAKLKDQGKVQVSFMVSAQRAAKIKEAIKLIEKNDLEVFALCEWGVRAGKNDGKPTWWIVFESNK